MPLRAFRIATKERNGLKMRFELHQGCCCLPTEDSHVSSCSNSLRIVAATAALTKVVHLVGLSGFIRCRCALCTAHRPCRVAPPVYSAFSQETHTTGMFAFTMNHFHHQRVHSSSAEDSHASRTFHFYRTVTLTLDLKP